MGANTPVDGHQFLAYLQREQFAGVQIWRGQYVQIFDQAFDPPRAGRRFDVCRAPIKL